MKEVLAQLYRATLLASLAAAGGVRAQEVAQLDESLAPQASEGVTSLSGGLAGLGRAWRVPPIGYSGSLSYDLRTSQTPGESKSTSHLITATITANSFVYQPWLATVNGSLGLTMDRSRDRNHTSEQDTFLQGGPTQTGLFLTGAARVNVFPSSRFPFELQVERNDSRVDNTLASTTEFTSQSVRLSQQYRPASGQYSASAQFDRREQFGAGFRDTQNALQGDFGTSWKHNTLSASLLFNEARRQASNEKTEFRSLVARHQYAPADPLSVSTTINLTQVAAPAINQSAASAIDQSFIQLSSVGLWRPAGPSLMLTSSVLALMMRDQASGQDLSNLGLTFGLSYALTKNAHFSASGSATATESNGTRAHGLGGSVGANWQADSIEFSGFRYDWFAGGTAGATATNGWSVGDATQTTMGGQLGHTVYRTWTMSPHSALTFNAGQTLGLSVNGGGAGESGGSESQRRLSNNLGVGWNVSGENRMASARLSFSDSRDLGAEESRFQLLNFQLSGNFTIDRYQSLSGDLTLQRSEQRSGQNRRPGDEVLLLGNRSTGSGAGGEIAYSHQRLFGVPRLRFTSRLRLAQDVLNQPGSFATITDRETRVWENRLDYLIGRLQTQLIFRTSEIDGRRHKYLMWRVQRSFGG